MSDGSRKVVICHLLNIQSFPACNSGRKLRSRVDRRLGRGYTQRDVDMRKQKGFSLIELLIVVAIILIIASIAIPNLLRARMNANETSAVAAVRTINTAQIEYNSMYPTVGFATTLASLGGTSCAPPSTTSACLIDSQLASGTKNGYAFALTGVTGNPAATYQIIASPVSPNQTGVRYFCSFADAVPRSAVTAIATCDTSITPLQ